MEPEDRPPALRELELRTLVGMPVDAARQVVEAAGGRLRAVAPGAVVSAEYRPDRVTVTVHEDRVVGVAGFG